MEVVWTSEFNRFKHGMALNDMPHQIMCDMMLTRTIKRVKLVHTFFFGRSCANLHSSLNLSADSPSAKVHVVTSYWYIMFISETINPSHLAIVVAIGKLWNIIGGQTPGYTKPKINIYHLYIRTCSSLKSIAFREHQHDLRSCWRHLHQDLPILPTVLDKVSSTIMHTAYNILCHFFWQEHHVKHTVVFHAT